MVFSSLNVILKLSRFYQRMPRRPKRKIHSNYIKTFVHPSKKIKSETNTNLKVDKISKMPCFSNQSTSNVEVLNSPAKSLNDKKEYKYE